MSKVRYLIKMSYFFIKKRKKMKTDKNDTNIQNHINDILTLYPGQLVLSPMQFAKLRNKSIHTLRRERKKSVGAEYKVSNKQIEYPVRAVAIWLNSITQTA